jgi:hypothetical protein
VKRAGGSPSKEAFAKPPTPKNIATTMKKHKLVKSLLPLVLICLVTFGSVSRCSAQISDVFSTAFKALSGFNFTYSVPVAYAGVGSHSTSNPIGYSVKFAPLRFGPIVEDTKNLVTVRITRSYSLVAKGIYRVQFDTLKKIGDDIIDQNQFAFLTSDSLVRAADTVAFVQHSWIPNNHLTINLGYAVNPNVDYNNMGLSASFPISELFMTAVTRLAPVGAPWLGAGVTVSAPSLTNVVGKRINGADTTRLSFSSSPSFSVEPFISLSTPNAWLSGLSLFADIGWKIQKFHGVSYIDPTTGKEPANVTSLPTVIDVTNFNIRFGLSFNVFGS